MEIPNRDKLEAEYFRNLNQLSSRHRRELKALLGDSPDLGRVPQAFWQKVEKEREDEIAAILILLFLLAGDRMRQGTNATTSEQQAETFARTHARRVSSSYTRHSIERLTTKLSEPEPPPTGQIVDDVFSDERDENIVVTTTTEARQAGAEDAVQEFNATSPDDTWVTEKDARVCPICRPLDGTKRDNWTRKFPSGPPAHPRCRCEISYKFEREGTPQATEV